MNIAVWIASGLLAAAYLAAGGMKLLTSKERLAENPSTAGGVEVAGTLGLILRRLTGIAPILAVAVFIAVARISEVVR